MTRREPCRDIDLVFLTVFLPLLFVLGSALFLNFLCSPTSVVPHEEFSKSDCATIGTLTSPALAVGAIAGLIAFLLGITAAVIGLLAILLRGDTRARIITWLRGRAAGIKQLGRIGRRQR